MTTLRDSRGSTTKEEKRREKQKKQKQVTGRLLFGPLSLRCSVVYGFTRARGKRTLAQRIACGVVKAVSFRDGTRGDAARKNQKTKKPKNEKTRVRRFARTHRPPFRREHLLAQLVGAHVLAGLVREEVTGPVHLDGHRAAAQRDVQREVVVRHRLDLVRDGHARQRLRNLAV